jgi:hypothetical protein
MDSKLQLDLAERASVAPYVDYPPTPRWYAPAVGLWAAGMAFVLANMSDNKSFAVPALVVLLVIEVAFMRWYRNYMGTMPNYENAPAEIRRELWRYAVGVVVAFAAICAGLYFGGALAGAIVAFSTVTIGLTVYERRYAAAAKQTKQRLS